MVRLQDFLLASSYTCTLKELALVKGLALHRHICVC